MITEDPLNEIIRPAFGLLPARMRSDEAEILLLSIGLQESGFKVRRQNGGGPAHGFWQFEKNGGARGVLEHPSTRRYAFEIARSRGVDPYPFSVWDAFTNDDILAAVFARLLLWSSPNPLPSVGHTMANWDYYLDAWRPGKPHVLRWKGNQFRAGNYIDAFVTHQRSS